MSNIGFVDYCVQKVIIQELREYKADRIAGGLYYWICKMWRRISIEKEQAFQPASIAIDQGNGLQASGTGGIKCTLQISWDPRKDTLAGRTS